MAKIRVTVTLDEDVYDAYKAISDATKTSFSSTLNDWLNTTVEGFRQINERVASLKRTPDQMINDLILFQEQMGEKNAVVDEQIRNLLAQRNDPQVLPSLPSNTGLKVYPPKPRHK